MKRTAGILSIVCVSLVVISCSLLGIKDPPTYTFTAESSPAEGGSVSPDSASYEEGETVTVIATAADGYAFGDWAESISGEVTKDENSLSFDITEDTEVTANFIKLNSIYDVEMIVADDASSMTLRFGQNEMSTSGFDDTDKESPPPPPQGSLHSYFSAPDRDLLYDYRSDTAVSVRWDLNYQIGNGDTLQFSWIIDATKLDGELILRNEDSSISVDMKSETSVDISTAESGSLIIEYELLNE